ncbi:hypothetical protein KIN20_029210 [Parelaphostrongylus tenuis]|uniref:Uncharacterized protein n=1 Tax=Parelaphostrongylus tenuis TaxID=148309 RepID=A0AAD5R2B9_PARTN|nr:hypothetical protein KIN20_029210 [Parelaphostrongylus tenuis]
MRENELNASAIRTQCDGGACKINEGNVWSVNKRTFVGACDRVAANVRRGAYPTPPFGWHHSCPGAHRDGVWSGPVDGGSRIPDKPWSHNDNTVVEIAGTHYGGGVAMYSPGMTSQRKVLDSFEWSKAVSWLSAPDVLLVQTGCCYEERGSGHLYAENRESIALMMKERLKGVRLITDDPSLALRCFVGTVHSVHMTSPTYGSAFIGLPNGMHTIQVMKGEKVYAEFSVKISDSNPLTKKWILVNHSILRSNVVVVASLVFLVLIAFLFACRQRLTSVLNRRGFLTGSSDTFERIPLYKSDDEDEEDVFDLQKL